MSSTAKKLKDEALDKIKQLYTLTDVAASMTLEALEEILEDVEARIEALK